MQRIQKKKKKIPAEIYPRNNYQNHPKKTHIIMDKNPRETIPANYSKKQLKKNKKPQNKKRG